uniref:Cytochrome P450 99A44 n=1 Tax=Beckmannia syzigachne TaxID=368345 RepID=A0A9E7V431_9POAL|nr:cytochrome P450 99A44 [Beckmannia syzigachne]
MELNTATLLSIALVSLTILVSVLRRKSASSSKKRRPPGPLSLPFIGSLLHLLTSQPPVVLRDLAKKYGPVMYLRLGQIDTVVISSPVEAQEVLRDNNLNFSSRPSLLATEIFCYDNMDIAFAPYGAYWRMLRKLCTMELLSVRKVRQFAPIRDSETMSLVRDVGAISRSGRPVNLASVLMSCSNSITAKAAFGEVCSAELREQFLSAMEVGVRLGGGLSIGDLFPSLWFLDIITGLKRRLWQARRQTDAVFETIIAECEARREKKKKTSTATTEDDDVLSVILRLRDEGEIEFPSGNTNIKAIILDLFIGGTETTATSVEWIMSELMRNPEVMAKVQAEVRRVFDTKTPQDHEVLIEELCYMRMMVKEVMRLHPPLPLLIPHFARETCDIGGFEVTAGSRILVNGWAIARHPDYWHDAEEFIPERFERSKVDYKGTHFEYLPFGSGRRMCPGSNFGLAALELILARLLYYFDWSLLAGTRPDEVDMDMVVGATLKRKNPLNLVVTPYNVPMES